MNDPFTNLRDPRSRPGLNGLYKGRIESRNDPMRAGRLRVRVEGVFKNELKVEELPWLYPQASAWRGGGLFAVPPLGEMVWVQFEEGDWEYGVWMPGFWGMGETPQGQSAARVWQTSWFGGDPWETGPLRRDSGSAPRFQDAPNNFGMVSPLTKRLELDDRKSREKIFLADRHDNLLWMNSEDGVVTIEAAGGNRAPAYFPRGITFSSNARQNKLSTQLYSYRGWLMTMDDAQEVGEWSAPSGNKLRFTDIAGERKGEMWVGGIRLVMDETSGSIHLTTPSGVGLTVDDEAATVRTTDSQYLRLDFKTGETTLRSSGNLKVHSDQDLILTAGGKATIDANAGVYFQSFPMVPVPGMPLNPEFSNPVSMSKLDRACDYPYYSRI